MTSYDDAHDPPLAVIIDRQRTLQSVVTNIQSRLRKTEDTTLKHGEQLTTLHDDVRSLTRAVQNQTRILVGLLVSAVLGSTSVTVALLISTSKHGLHLP